MLDCWKEASEPAALVICTLTAPAGQRQGARRRHQEAAGVIHVAVSQAGDATSLSRSGKCMCMLPCSGACYWHAGLRASGVDWDLMYASGITGRPPIALQEI
jgi:hypothetical protein